MSRLMTTPNMTVSYAYSLPGSNQSPLATDQNLSPFNVPVTIVPTQTSHLIQLHGKMYLLGAKKGTLSLQTAPLAWERLHLTTRSKGQATD